MKTLEQVMAENPTLNPHGCARSRFDKHFNMADQREYMLRMTPKIDVSMAYLETLPLVKLTSRLARDSYELKHKAERTQLAMDVADGYIPNGCLIAAAYMLELDVKPTGINAIIGVGWLKGER